MNRFKAAVSAVLLVTAVTAGAQQQGTIDHTAATCMLGGEYCVLKAAVSNKGTLRVFFRRAGATDWCSVDGTNNGIMSTVTMPKFEVGDELEYYFVVVDGKQVVAKSPTIYKIKCSANCETLTVRHPNMLPMECLPAGANPVADSVSAAYSARGAASPSSPQ